MREYQLGSERGNDNSKGEQAKNRGSRSKLQEESLVETRLSKRELNLLKLQEKLKELLKSAGKIQDLTYVDHGENTSGPNRFEPPKVEKGFTISNMPFVVAKDISLRLAEVIQQMEETDRMK